MTDRFPDARLLSPLVISALMAAVIVAAAGILVPFPEEGETAGFLPRLILNPFVLAIGYVGITAIFYGVIQIWASASDGAQSTVLGWLSGQGGGRQKAPFAADASLQTGLFIERWQVLSDRRSAPLSYAIWVLPLLGFIGTVIGISEAIGDLGTVFSDGDRQEALESVLGALRYAFDTTFAGLVLVIPVMALATWLSLSEDRARDAALASMHGAPPAAED